MGTRPSMIFAVLPVGVLLLVPTLFAQGRGGESSRAPRVLDREKPMDKPYDPHDLAGIWTRNSSVKGYGGGGTCYDCGDRGFSNEVPPFTPQGQKMFEANKPSYGWSLGSADAAAHPEEHIGRRRAVAPSNGTDPYQYCNPEGVDLPFPSTLVGLELSA